MVCGRSALLQKFVDAKEKILAEEKERVATSGEGGGVRATVLDGGDAVVRSAALCSEFGGAPLPCQIPPSCNLLSSAVTCISRPNLLSI